MHNFMRRTVFVYLLCFSVLSLGAGYFAFETTLAASIDEATIAKRRAQLESELAHLETLIKQQQEILQSKQGERVSLERDLEIIDAEISELL